MPAVSKSELLARLPPESGLAPHAPTAKIVVLDDDPTGTQTVHGVPVLTTWETAELIDALREPGPCFYILTNSRAYPPARACEINREIGRHLQAASDLTGRRFAIVSRSDSTLRGHFPAETDALMAALGGNFDGTLIVPTFFAGGRLTIDDVHYVATGDTLTPAGETEFARDRAFGYSASNLRAWVEEKTGGRTRASEVVSISIDDLRSSGSAHVAAKLHTLPRGGVAVVNAAAPADLTALTHALAALEREGRRYLYRTAADFVAAYANIAPRPLLAPEDLLDARSSCGGLLVAGSYVGTTSDQLAAVFAACPKLERVELNVASVVQTSRRNREIARCTSLMDAALARRSNVALFTSRRFVAGRDPVHSLAIGEAISGALVAIIRALDSRPRWLVAKGGITSSDLATAALGVRRALVLGQALPGVPVWQLGTESKWPGLPYVIFPGNVGTPDSLAQLIRPLLAQAAPR